MASLDEILERSELFAGLGASSFERIGLQGRRRG